MYASSLNFMDNPYYLIDLQRFFSRNKCSFFKTIENQYSHFGNSIRSIFFQIIMVNSMRNKFNLKFL